MTAKGSEEGPEDVLSENILRIADELVRQVDIAKKLVVVTLVALIVGVPVGWHLAGALSGSRDSFMVIGYATILIAIAFVVVGIRQWMVLSKWTERYKAYQDLQKKIDAKLDFEGQAGNAS